MSEINDKLKVKKIPIDRGNFSVISHLLEGAYFDLLGNEDLLKGFKVGLFCSIKCPGEIIYKSLNLIHKLDEDAFCLVSGFHSPLERECYNLLINSSQKMIICPARNISKMRLSKKTKEALLAHRLAIVSPFSEKYKGTSKKTAESRNLMVAALADRILMLHASPNGMLEKLVKTMIGWDKKVYTIESEYNAHLIKLGVTSINAIDKVL